MTDDQGHPDHHVTPRRLLGPWQTASVVVGMVVGAGIFRTASVVAADLESPLLIYAAWALGGVFALAGALCYAELSSAYPDQGGDYRFLQEAFGDNVAFLFAWSRFAIIFTASAAMLAFVGADYLAQLIPMDQTARAMVGAAVIVVLSAINLRGIRTSARSQVALVTLDVVALLALGAAALWLIASGAPAPVNGSGTEEVFSARGFGAAMVFVMLAYGGFNDAATLSAEVRRPRDMTLAMVGGMGAVTLLYLLANWAYVHGLGAAGLAASDAPAATLMLRAFGPLGETLMVAAVGIATLAVINALVIVGGRTLYAAAADEPALGRFAVWDERTGVPRTAILAQAALTLALIAWGAWTRGGFATMVDYMAPVYWLFLTLSALSLLVLRYRRPDTPRPYKVPLFPWMAILFAGGSAFVTFASIAYVGWTGSLISFGMLALGFVLRLVLRWRRPPAASQPIETPAE